MTEGSMAAQTIISIFNQLLDPQKVNEAQEALKQIVSSVDALPLLFEIFQTNNSANYINITLDCIGYCMRLNQFSMNDSNFQYVRSQLLHLLTAIDVPNFIVHIVNVVTICIDLYPQPWEELFSFTLSNLEQPNTATFNVQLQLINLLFRIFPDEIFAKAIDNILQFVIYGFKIDDTLNQSISVELASKIVLRTNNAQYAKEFRPLVQTVFQNIVEKNPQLFLKISNSVQSITTSSLSIIDLSFGISFAFVNMNSAATSLELKEQMTLLLKYCLSFTDFAISEDQLRRIMELLFTYERYLLSQRPNDRHTLLFDVCECLSCIFCRFPSDRIVHLLTLNIERYIGYPDPYVRMFPILLIQAAGNVNKKGTSAFLFEIFQALFNLLSDPCDMIVQKVCHTLSNFALDFPQFVRNQPQCLMTATAFFVARPSLSSSLLLSALTNAFDETDAIFELVYENSKAMIMSHSISISNNGLDILDCLIQRSSEKYLKCAQDLITFVTEKLNEDPSKYCGLFKSISILFSKRNFDDHLPELFQLYLVGLNSQDAEIIEETLNGMGKFFSTFNSQEPIESLAPIQKDIVEIIMKIYADYNPRFEYENTALNLYQPIVQVIGYLVFLCGLNLDICTLFINIIAETFSKSSTAPFFRPLIALSIANTMEFFTSLSSFPQQLAAIISDQNVIQLIKQIIEHSLLLMNDKNFKSLQARFAQWACSSVGIGGIDQLGIDPIMIFEAVFETFRNFSLCNPCVYDEPTALEAHKFFLASFIILFQIIHQHPNFVQYITAIKTLLNTRINDTDNLDIIQSALVIYPFLIREFPEFHQGQDLLEILMLIFNYIKILPRSLVGHCGEFITLVLQKYPNTLPKTIAPDFVGGLAEKLNEIKHDDRISIIAKESIASALCQILLSLDADQYAQIYPLIFHTLPFSYKTQYTDIAMQFVNTVQFFIRNNEEMCLKILEIYVLVLTNSSIHGKLGEFPMFMAKYIDDIKNKFLSEEAFQQRIETILDNDEISICTFAQTYQTNLTEFQTKYDIDDSVQQIYIGNLPE